MVVNEVYVINRNISENYLSEISSILLFRGNIVEVVIRSIDVDVDTD